LAPSFIGIVVVFLYGFVGWLLFGFGVVDALTQTALTLTTVGLGVGRPLSAAEKLFTASVAIGGVTAFLVFLTMLAAALTEGRFMLGQRRRRMQNRINDLSGHYILCAYGRVGRAVARELEGEGVRFVVVDQKEELEDLLRYDGFMHIIGDPTHEVVLRQAGLERARAIIIAVDSDSDAVYISLIARDLNPKIYIVARAGEPDSPERLLRAGADRVVSPYVTSGRHMALLAVRPRIVDYVDIDAPGDRKLRLEEVAIEPESPLVGRTVGEVASEASVILLRRQTGETIPSPPSEERVLEGDLLVLFGEAESSALRRP
jgi:voltage-gated potassium channel